MRASTLFALTLAILVGLGVAIAGKRLGFFASPPATEAPPKKPEVQALVAARNLFAGDMIDTAGVRVRVLRPDELDHYEKHKDDYLPAVVAATFLRLTEKNIYADQPILKEHLKELAKPEPLHTRLLPRMRAVNLSLLKEHAAGGLIQLGDWVDVLLTSTVDRKDQGPTVRTACIIPHARVVAKRNSLWPIYAPLPEDKPIQFTIEANPYRAALIEFARTRGQLSMTALPNAEQQKLEALREQVLQAPADAASPVLFGTPDSTELDEEESRVTAYTRGELAITEGDLTRIFNITSPAPPLAPVTIERMQGVMRAETAYFSPLGTRLDPKAVTGGSRVSAAPTRATADVRFSQPKDPNCKDCESRRKK